MKPHRHTVVLVIAALVVIVAGGTLLFRQIPETVSAPLFVLVVILEVIFAPIPGGAVGYLGAARFGFWQAWPLLYVGNIVGTTIVFFLARRWGTRLFEQNVPDRVRRRYDGYLQQKPILLWLCYAVPVIPVDVLSILAGVSSISARRFLWTAYTGYISYTAIIAYVGAFLADYIGVSNAVSVLGGIFFLGIVWWAWKERRNSARERRAPTAKQERA
jgi:uncharacterized membrane protein YdjX (TVP38/TMEM64 family)